MDDTVFRVYACHLGHEDLGLSFQGILVHARARRAQEQLLSSRTTRTSTHGFLLHGKQGTNMK